MPTYRLRVGGVTGGADEERVREAVGSLGFVRSVALDEVEEAEAVEVVVTTTDVVNDLRQAVESLGYDLVDVEPEGS